MSGGNIIRRGMMLVGIVTLAGAARVAGAQVPPKPVPKDTLAKRPAAPVTSTKRVKIQKEATSTKVSGGEIAPATSVTPPCEVAAPIDVDSIRADQRTIDSLAHAFEVARLRAAFGDETAQRVAEAREQMLASEAARARDQADAAAIALQRHLARGWYFGAAGGFSTPMRDTRNGFTGGYDAMIPVGYDFTGVPLGLRVDASADHLNGTRLLNQSGTLTSASGDVTAWTLSGDLKLRLPAPGGSTRTHLYAVGGVGAGRVAGGVYGVTGPNAGQTLSFANAHTDFSWNVGGGIAVEWGPAEVFAETRFVQTKTDLGYWSRGGLSEYTAFAPVVIGLQWF